MGLAAVEMKNRRLVSWLPWITDTSDSSLDGTGVEKVVYRWDWELLWCV